MYGSIGMVEVVGVEAGRVAVRSGGDRPQEVDMTQHLHADLFVHPHLRELVGGEAPRLVQQLVGNDELADVVHERGETQPLQPGRHEVELFADVAGVVGDALRMPGRVPVLGLERVDEHAHRLVVRFLHTHVRSEHLAGDEDRNDDEKHDGGAEREV